MNNKWEPLITQSNTLLKSHKHLPTLHTLHDTQRKDRHSGTGNMTMQGDGRSL